MILRVVLISWSEHVSRKERTTSELETIPRHSLDGSKGHVSSHYSSCELAKSAHENSWQPIRSHWVDCRTTWCCIGRDMNIETKRQYSMNELTTCWPARRRPTYFAKHLFYLRTMNRGIESSNYRDLLKKRTKCRFFRSGFEHIIVNSWRESSIRFVRGSSSRYCPQ